MLNELQSVFRDVFEDQSLIITPETTANNIKMWDSLSHMVLMTSIEEKFNIKFSFNEVMGFDKVGDLIDTIEKKLKTNNDF
jgi:acyl carrier protein